MTDTERIKAICKVAQVDDIGDLSDGYHTFNQLYYQRMVLFAALVKQNCDKAWKSLRHEDGELCFGGGWFIVGIDTPEGSYTYHYEDKYFSLFDCVELERGKHWDGHTEKDVTRLLSLENDQKWTKCSDDLPDMDVDVLGTIKEYGDVAKFARMKTYLNDAGWEWVLTDDIEGNSYHPDEIIAWMPLPESYKGE